MTGVRRSPKNIWNPGTGEPVTTGPTGPSCRSISNAPVDSSTVMEDFGSGLNFVASPQPNGGPTEESSFGAPGMTPTVFGGGVKMNPDPAAPEPGVPGRPKMFSPSYVLAPPAVRGGAVKKGNGVINAGAAG
jgi:hypothetical protein